MDTLLPVGEVIEMKPLPQYFFKYIYKGKKVIFFFISKFAFSYSEKVNKIQMTPFLGSTSIQCLLSVSVIDGHELLARYHSELGCQGNIIIIKFCIESKWLHFICTFTSL